MHSSSILHFSFLLTKLLQSRTFGPLDSLQPIELDGDNFLVLTWNQSFDEIGEIGSLVPHLTLSAGRAGSPCSYRTHKQ